MSIVQQISAKGNIKKTTNNDLPFSPAQPVINSYYATSTTNQTVINMGFSIQTSGVFANTDVFWLFVDGKKLDLGSSNDYTFTNVMADGTSSQVTLNYSLASNLHIQAFKLGLKPEIQFTMDNRFTQLYANQNAAFQGFVSQTDFLMTATSTAGTPTAGTFYSSIVGRASMVDLSQDLKPRMGIERIMTQSVQQLQSEFGPSGQPVYSTPNDQFGQIRFVGQWTNSQDSQGERPNTATANDYVEITFYGTGLNVLTYDNSTRQMQASVDGGANGSNLLVGGSSVLLTRNYGSNMVIQVIKGLTLGVHTVTITCTVTDCNIYGFEVLNESSSVKVNSGNAYVGGQKYIAASQSSFSYSAPVSGTTGGRVAIYETASGTIGEAFTQNATSASYLTSSSHTNEEVVRTIQFNEFGAGRSDDFSSNGTSISRAFALDDNTTSLVASGVDLSNQSNPSSKYGIRIGGTTQFIVINFVGTGLDIWRQDTTAGGADLFSVTIDGTNQGNLNSTGSTALRRERIASGLPYGTHAVKILSTSQSTFALFIYAFTVYQPITPAIPSGAIQIGSYNVMATYAANSTSGPLNLGTGVLRKTSAREFLYSGNWTSQFSVSDIGGLQVVSNATSDFIQYTFFGTGFDWRFSNSTTTSTWQLTLDGSTSFTGITTSGYGSGFTSFVNSTGVLTAGTTSVFANGFSVSGLTLGLHTIKIARLTGSGTVLDHVAMDIITPIHSVKSNLYVDLQNTLMVGSNAISDDRQTQPIKSALPQFKSWAQAVGVSSSPTTTSTTLVPMPDMSCVVKTTGGALQMFFSASAYSSTVNIQAIYRFYVDGVAVSQQKNFNISPTVNSDLVISDFFTAQVAAGYHKIDVYWATSSNTLVTDGIARNLMVREI